MKSKPTKTKGEKRDIKKRKRMPVSGKKVFALREIIKKGLNKASN